MEMASVMMKAEFDLLDANDLKQEHLSTNNNLPTTLMEQELVPSANFEHVTINHEKDEASCSKNYDPLGLNKNRVVKIELNRGEVTNHLEFQEALFLHEDSAEFLEGQGDLPFKLRSENIAYICSTCNKKCRNLFTYQQHKKTHGIVKFSNPELEDCLIPKLGIHNCICGKGFRIRKHIIACLHKHLKEGVLNMGIEGLLSLCGVEKNDNCLFCTTCDFSCTRSDILKQHLKTHKKKTKVRNLDCDQCDYVGKRFSSLTRHKLVHTDVKPLACHECSYRCKLKSKLIKHMKIHFYTPIKCDYCDFTCRLKSSMKSHRKKHHAHQTPKIQYACTLCTYSGSLRSAFQRHQLVHQVEKPFKCDLCDYRCKLSNKLKVHKLKHVKQSDDLTIIYKCEECEYTSTRSGSLKIHKRKHITDKVYSCDKCIYTTKIYDHLELHKNIHSDKKAFPCPKCSYVSLHSGSLRRHLLTHSGVKPFNCDLCDYKTTQASSLRNHRYTHTGVRPHKCDKCDYASSTRHTLKKHKVVHDPIIW